MPRGKKVAVTEKERQEWLTRLESGEGITSIAKKARRDIRTVRDSLETAKEERLKTEAKKELLLGIIRQHQERLLQEADRLRKLVMSYPPVHLMPVDPEEKMIHEGLLEHMKRSSLRKMLESFESAVDEVLLTREKIKNILEQKESELISSLPEGVVTNPWVEALIKDLDSGLLRNDESNPDYIKEKRGDGTYEIRFASYKLVRDTVKEEYLKSIVDAHRRLVATAKQYISQFEEQRESLRTRALPVKKELDTLVIRQYISGKCIYCPIR
jgi:hypothetical protein